MFHCFCWVKKTCCSLQSKSAIDAIEQNLYVATRERNHSVCLVWELAPATKELGEGFSPHRASTLYLPPMVRQQPGPRAKYLLVVNLRSFNG